jgi:hypothetical protein
MFGECYKPSEFRAFWQQAAATCKRLNWDRVDLDNFSLQLLGTEVHDNLAKRDWEYLLTSISELPTPLPRVRATQQEAPPRNRPAEQEAQPARGKVCRTLAELHADLLSLATFEEQHGLYLTMTKRLHPDVGGDTAQMQKLNLLWEELSKERVRG